MNFIQVFKSYRYLNSDSIKSNNLYKPSQVLIQPPVKKYTIPHDFFSKINAIASANTTNNNNGSPWRKIMYINTDLDYNFDEQVLKENELINLNKKLSSSKTKIMSYLLTSICIIFPFSYYYYYYYIY
jgi:hypothetical protein